MSNTITLPRGLYCSIDAPLPHRPHADPNCPCSLCKQFDHSETLSFPHLQRQTPDMGSIAGLVEVVEAIDSETGQRTVYYWPVR